MRIEDAVSPTCAAGFRSCATASLRNKAPLAAPSAPRAPRRDMPGSQPGPRKAEGRSVAHLQTRIGGTNGKAKGERWQWCGPAVAADPLDLLGSAQRLHRLDRTAN